MRPLVAFVCMEAIALLFLTALWLSGGATGSVSEELQGSSELHSSNPALADSAAADVRRDEASVPKLAENAPEPATVFGIVAHGVVHDEHGAPIAAASVSFVRDGEYETGETLRSGAFAVPDLASGMYELRVSAKGFADHRAEVELDTRAWQRFEIVLRPWTVVKIRFAATGGETLTESAWPWRRDEEPYVVATVEPLAGDLPVAERPAHRCVGVGEWVSVNGYDGGDLLSLKAAGFAGELHLHREPPVYASLLRGHVVLDTRRIELEQRELTFEIDAEAVAKCSGDVRLRLVDGARGAVLPGAKLNLRIGPGKSVSAETDEAGIARFEGVYPGIGLLRATVPEREQLELDVRVLPGVVLDLGDVVLSTLAVITGRIIDEEGKPVTNASIDWWDLDRRTIAPLSSSRMGAATNAEGHFTLRGAGRHRYALVAQRGYPSAAYATVDARHGDPPEVVMRLAPTTKVRLSRSNQAPDGMVLSIHSEHNAPVRVLSFGEQFCPPHIFIAPGTYTVQMHDSGDQLVHEARLVVGTEAVTLELP